MTATVQLNNNDIGGWLTKVLFILKELTDSRFEGKLVSQGVRDSWLSVLPLNGQSRGARQDPQSVARASHRHKTLPPPASLTQPHQIHCSVCKE